MYELRPYQRNDVERVRDALSKHESVLYQLMTGGGKCLGKGTPVLLFDGRVKAVEDIKVGDTLIGPDSEPRTVVSICRGDEPLYRIVPKKGDPYVVNESHILSLKQTRIYKNPKYPSQGNAGRIVNIPVSEYIGRSNGFKHIHKGWRCGVEFKPHDIPVLLEPYFVGLWLGDGNSRHASITTGDSEIRHYIESYTATMDLRVRIEPNSENSINCHIINEERGSKNPVIEALRHYHLIQNKHIPYRYKTGSREERLHLLAGILDTDGYWTGKGYDIILKSEKLLDDVLFVARSLGFACYKSARRKMCANNGVKGTYWSRCINGPVEQIPCRLQRKKAEPRKQKKDPLVHGIQVESIGVGEYFGFEINGPDRLFLLGDFTVTHNTVVAGDIARRCIAKRTRTTFVLHRKELIRQTTLAFRNMGIDHGVIAPGYRPRRACVQIASVNKLARIDNYETDFFIFDEGHHLGAATWLKARDRNPRAKVLVLTATPARKNGKGLSNFIEHMVCGPKPSFLIANGFIVPSKIYAPDLGIDRSQFHRLGGDFRNDEMSAAMDRREITGCMIEHYRKYAEGMRALVFTCNLTHAAHVVEQFKQAGYRAASIDGKMDEKTRARLLSDIASHRLDHLVSCDLLNEGVDVPVVDCGISLRPTASIIVCLQQWGRLLRPAPGKKHALILDHVANVHYHGGGPDVDRVWTLENGCEKPDSAVQYMTCPVCMAAHRRATHCPECGYLYPRQAEEKRPLPKQREGQLYEVQRGEQIPIPDYGLTVITPEQRDAMIKEARTLSELHDVARKLGYSSGWAWARWNARGKNRRQKDKERSYASA